MTMPSPMPSPPAAAPDLQPPEAPRRRRLRRWVAPGLALALIGASLALDVGTLFVLPVLFVLIVPFEKMFPRHRGQKVRRPEVRTDMSHALAAPALNIAALAVAVVIGLLSLAWIPGLLIRPLVSVIGTTVSGFALQFWVYLETGSVTDLAIVAVAFTLPATILSPFAGAEGEQVHERRDALLQPSGPLPEEDRIVHEGLDLGVVADVSVIVQ